MLKILSSRRSTRKFTAEPVSPEVTDLLVQAALYSASSRGIRPWELIVVTDREKLSELSRVKEHGSAFLEKAPLALVVLGDPQARDVWIEDASILSSNILLEAEALDLGACWIQIRNRTAADGTASQEVVRSILKIPESLSVLSIIAIGQRAEEKRPYSKADLQRNKVHYERY